MPPSVPDHHHHHDHQQHHLPAICETSPNDEYDDMFSPVESIEVVGDESGQEERIVCQLSPPTTCTNNRGVYPRRSSLLDDMLDDDEDENEEEDQDDVELGIEVPVEEDAATALLDALWSGCVGACADPFSASTMTKGILKTSKDYSNIPLYDRNVSFNSVDIKEFDMTLGDHPSACSGPPVCLDWDSKASETVVKLDEYENERGPRRKRRQLKLSYRDRKNVLEHQRGFSTQEVNQAWAEALRIRQQRQETLKRGLFLMAFDDVWESAQRKCHRVAESVGLMSPSTTTGQQQEPQR